MPRKAGFVQIECRLHSGHAKALLDAAAAKETDGIAGSVVFRSIFGIHLGLNAKTP